MPTYSFKCQSCNHIQDAFFSMDAEKRINCEACRSTNVQQYFGNYKIAMHGLTTYKDPRGYNQDLTMQDIKRIEKSEGLVYGSHDELKQEARKNREYKLKTESTYIKKEIKDGCNKIFGA